MDGCLGAGLEGQMQDGGMLSSTQLASAFSYQGIGPSWSQHSQNLPLVFQSKFAQGQIEQDKTEANYPNNEVNTGYN